MLNKVVLVGYLGADPEKTETPNGKTVVRFSIPLHNPYAKKEDASEWMQCEVWNQPATFLHQYGKKGDMVVVEGRLRNQRYTDKEGNTKYRSFVSVDSLRLKNNRKADDSNNYQNNVQNNPTTSQNNQQKIEKEPVNDTSDDNLNELFKGFDFDE